MKFIDYCHKYFIGNVVELKDIDKLERKSYPAIISFLLYCEQGLVRMIFIRRSLFCLDILSSNSDGHTILIIRSFRICYQSSLTFFDSRWNISLTFFIDILDIAFMIMRFYSANVSRIFMSMHIRWSDKLCMFSVIERARISFKLYTKLFPWHWWNVLAYSKKICKSKSIRY